MSSSPLWVEECMPITLVRSKGFNSHELAAIKRVVEEYEDHLLEAWNAHARG